MIELALLQGLGNRDNFNKYRFLLNPKTLSIQSLTLLKDYEVYFDTFDHSQIDPNTFVTFFFNTRHPYLDEKTIQEYKEIFNRLENIDNKQEIDVIFKGFEQQEFYHELKRNLDNNLDINELQSKVQEFLIKLPSKDVDDEDMDIKHALEQTTRENGLNWRCQALRNIFKGGLILGDFGIIAGFVGSGKTSFMASESSYMAQQLKDEERIYWLSNEGDRSSILPRLYSATLNATEDKLRQFPEKAQEKYIKLMKGDKNRVIIKNIQGWSAKNIEELILQKKPKLVIIDLLDHVNGFDKYSSKESSFEKYNKLYQWAREMATKHCPILGVSQLNGEGEDNMYPKMSQLRGSRVDKQAAATFQLGIGQLIGDEDTRYLSITKEKMGIGEWKAQVRFDRLRSRFI